MSTYTGKLVRFLAVRPDRQLAGTMNPNRFLAKLKRRNIYCAALGDDEACPQVTAQMISKESG